MYQWNHKHKEFRIHRESHSNYIFQIAVRAALELYWRESRRSQSFFSTIRALRISQSRSLKLGTVSLSTQEISLSVIYARSYWSIGRNLFLLNIGNRKLSALYLQIIYMYILRNMRKRPLGVVVLLVLWPLQHTETRDNYLMHRREI